MASAWIRSLGTMGAFLFRRTCPTCPTRQTKNSLTRSLVVSLTSKSPCHSLRFDIGRVV